MKFEHQISITSESGVGSSSTINELKKLLTSKKWRWVSGGAIFRAMAARASMSVEDFAIHVEKHLDVGYDKKIDDEIAEEGKTNWIVCESRLSHYFMPHAFKVLLTCDIDVRVERRKKDFPELGVETVKANIERRDRSDNTRYALLYPGCHWLPADFDLHLDTCTTPPDKVAKRIVVEHALWVEKHCHKPALTS